MARLFLLAVSPLAVSALAVPALAVAAAAGSSAAASVLNATVSAGVLLVNGSAPRQVGFAFSALNAVVAELFAPLSPPDAASFPGGSLLNSRSGLLSFLTVANGTYLVDEPLSLARQLVLVLDSVVVQPAPGFSRPWGGLIELNGTDFVGVVAPGGPASARFVCEDASMAPSAVRAIASNNVLVDGISVQGCGATEGGAVHFQGVPGSWGPTHAGGQVSNCDISGSLRAIWLETVARVAVVGNTLHGNAKHTLDFDAFSTNCTATQNVIYNNTQEAVFIEQGAKGHVIAGNMLGPGNANGVAVYNNNMNVSCEGHVIVDNDIVGNVNDGVSVGSTAPKAGAPDVGVFVVGNRIRGNGAAARPQGVHSNGAQLGTVYAANRDSDGVSAYTQRLGTAANVSFFDALDREVALNY